MNNGVQVSEYAGKTIGYYGGKFLPFHNGHCSCILKASQMVDVLFVVVSYDDEWDKSLCEDAKFRWVSNRVRERWITQAFNHFPNIRVLSHYEKRSKDYMNDDSIITSNNELLKKVGGKIDVCFSSEPEYEAYYNKVLPNSKHVILYKDRTNISATEIREGGVYEYWEFLPRTVQTHFTKRICICGVESTGKSTLTEKLASIYDTNYVSEYGRDYYEDIGGCFDIMELNDLVKITCGHNHVIEQSIADSNRILFIDTDNIYTQFFVQEEFGEKHDTISKIIESNIDEIDLYIYLEPSLEHELDGMRQEKSREDKARENQVLKDLYSYYGKDIKVVNSPSEMDKIESLIDELFT